MKKALIGLGMALTLLFCSNNNVNAEMIEIDASLDEDTSELYMDPNIIDFHTYIHETDSGKFKIVNNRLTPIIPLITADLDTLFPLATTANYYPVIRNGERWVGGKVAINGQRITFGNRPITSGTTYTRRIQIRSNFGDGPVYYDNTNVGGRSQFSFNANRIPEDHISFIINHYSATDGYYHTWITM